MKHRVIVGLLVAFGLVLALGSGLAMASHGSQGNETNAEGALSPQAAVGTAFTYQGHLKKSGQPVNGTCDVAFDLYDAEVGGNYVAYDEATVSVNDGHFRAVVDPYAMTVGDVVFDGDARWMSISVRCPAGSGNYTTLPGRVAITAVPYALTLRPGAVVEDMLGVPSTLSVTNHSEAGIAVYGENTSLDTSSDWQAYGGKFVSNSRGGIGVYGENTDDADFGWGYGVYGKSNAAFGYGLYSEGNAHVEGRLTWRPKDSHISIPAAAFGPQINDVYDLPQWCGYPEYLNLGHQLVVYSGGDCPVEDYVAPVQLPHGATVMGVTFYYHDINDYSDATISLERYQVNGPREVLASVSSVTGQDDSYAPVTNYNQIDNSNYTYYLAANLPSPDNLWLHYVVIDYTISEPY